MNESAEKNGRDPKEIEVSWGDNEIMGEDPVAAAEKLRAQGVTRVIVPSVMFLQNPEEQLEEFGERVVSKISDI